MTTFFKNRNISLIFLVCNYLKYFTDLFPDAHIRLVSNSELKPDLPFYRVESLVILVV